MTVFDAIDAARDRWDVLSHPFYVRWSDGDLTNAELATYAGQYRHAVIALAEASELAAAAYESSEDQELLNAHATEERQHIALWDRFAAAAGASTPVGATAETYACVRSWAREPAGDLSASLAVLYAIESSQPRISEVKRSGLIEHYGFEPESPAIAYFDVHAVRDHDHAAQHRALLMERIDGRRTESLVAAADDALAGNWRLLDGVERLCAREAR